jgi:hypothetical protein
MIHDPAKRFWIGHFLNLTVVLCLKQGLLVAYHLPDLQACHEPTLRTAIYCAAPYIVNVVAIAAAGSVVAFVEVQPDFSYESTQLTVSLRATLFYDNTNLPSQV